MKRGFSEKADQDNSFTMKIEQHVPLAPLNWFRTGGEARFYCEPSTPEEYQEALQFQQKHELDLFVLGEGANILVNDDGFRGLVMKPHNTEIAITQDDSIGKGITVSAGAGVEMQNLIDWCLDAGVGGLEEFSGIPGTVGGSVYINLHYFDHLLSDFLVKGTVINRTDLDIFEADNEWFQFGYDESKFHEKEHILIDAQFSVSRVSSGEAEYAKGRRDEIIRHRNRRYPESHTCGSFFRNFLPEEVSLEINDKRMVFVAYYLDKLGIKGELAVGDAVVSFKHANMIVNQGEATSEQIVALARKMQTLVQQEFGILPKPECQLIGFDDYPLLTE